MGLDPNPEELEKTKLENARYSINSEAFKQWQDKFKKKNEVRKSKVYSDGWKLVPIAETLTKVQKISTVVSDNDCLTQNLLYACFQARHAKNPGRELTEGEKKIYSNKLDHAEQARRNYQNNVIKKLPKVVSQIETLLGFLRTNRQSVASALEHSAMTSIGVKEVAISGGCDSPHIVESLLTRLADGFKVMQTADHPGLLDDTIDFVCGPFKLHPCDAKCPTTGIVKSRTLVFPSGKRPNVIDLGLLFHLTFILRYFTGGKMEGFWELSLADDGFLMFSGPMLKGGDPKGDIVAHLFNATFEKSLEDACSGEDVRLKLKDLLDSPLYKYAKGSRSYFDGVQFIGWSFDVDMLNN